jgi:diguanylate cyclase (GGDEF)-like protein/PAS domain S-box-containing protein
MSRVLVVDDKEENLYYLQTLLSAHGYEIDTARHGAEALVKARKRPPDLVVSDLLMPVMDGYTLLRHWKADPQLRDIRFVVYTATYTEPEDERLAISLGADAFILKPAEPEVFLARIGALRADASAARPLPPRVPLGDEDALMRSYSETLIRKLEEKSLQLEQTNRELLLDIAKREQVEAQLRLLHFAVLQSSEALLITDAELDLPGPRIVFANPAFSRMTGYDVTELIGLTPRILQGPRTDRTLLLRLRAELERGETFSGEAVNYRKDGSEYDQEWHVAPVQNADGVTTHYVAVLRDITARKQAAQALHESAREQRELGELLELERQRLLAAQRVAKIGSWETDLTTNNVIWSEETHRIHETEPGSFDPTHQDFLQIVHPEDRERVDEAFRGSIHTSGEGMIEHRLLLPDGRIKHVEERWQIVWDAQHAPARAIGTCQDISERKQAESLLLQTRDRLALATQSAQIGIWDWDLVADRLVWDEQMLRLYGLAEGEFGEVYAAWSSCLHPEDRERVSAEIDDAIAGRSEYRSRFRIIRPDGQLRDIEANALVQRAADGTALHMIGANRDISEQVQADRRIRYLNRVYAMTSSVNALIVHAERRAELFEQACRIAVDVGGFQLAMLGVLAPGGLDFVALAATDPEALAAVREVLSSRDAAASPMAAQALQTRIASVSNDSQTDPRTTAPQLHARFGIHSMTILPLVVGDSPVGVLALYAAESEFFHTEEIALLTQLAGDIALAAGHIDQRERLAFLANYDELTGLANRTLFQERVGQFVRSAAKAGGQIAVLLLDLERFKNVNDSLGRRAGDQLLQQVAAWLTAHVGDANLLARIDADHFALVLPADGGRGDIAHVIEPMMAAFLRESFHVDGATLRVAARAGIAMYPADGQDAEALFRLAEAALKKANTSGARYLFYAQQMTDAVASKLSLESQLRSALENNEFVLHYQPKVDLVNGRLVGAEALIRWNNPRTGLMAPGLFIPILEETGMIIDVGHWALKQALSEWLKWSRTGLPAVRIAVNVSPLQLRDRAFISQLGQAIAVHRDAAQGLELEITESMVMDDVKQSIATLQTIREMGVRVAIDDFGTGFSSLGYLSKLPIDALKIDRMFISDMTASADGLSLVSTMLTLARSLRLKVIAEGVETDEQARLLRLLQCDEMQGYLVSPPIACTDFEARFLSGDWRMG